MAASIFFRNCHLLYLREMKITKNILATLLVLCLYSGVKAQISDPIVLVNQLPAEIEETSGLIFLNGKLWTHNDSGGEPILYSIDTTSGAVIERKVIAGVANEDWEDIAYDETYVYIGNFGSMSTHLQILRITIEDLENTELDTLMPSIINFTYGTEGYPEENFSATATRFDCEAMIAKDDTLFLFSKNWIDHKTYLYAIPNIDTTFHTITPIDSLILDYLVTGADYNYATNTVALCGYTYNTANLDVYPHFTILSDFDGNNFLSGTQTHKALSGILNIGIQVEGITFRDSGRIWISNEKATKSVLTIQPKLRELKITGFPLAGDLDIHVKKASIYPNPANESITICAPGKNFTFEIFDDNGKLLMKTHKKAFAETSVNISFLKAGNYILKINAGNEKCEIKFVKL